MTGSLAAPSAEGKKMIDVFSDQQPPVDAARNPIGWELARLADDDPRIVALSADLSSGLQLLRERHPQRYIELGIAETNAVSVAAGLAATGMLPYVMSMGPFGAIKCAEQLRTDVGYTQLPVRFMGRLSGLAMGFFGPSHQAIEDIAIARTIPNLTVVSSADATATLSLMRSTFDLPGPVFFRITEHARPVYQAPRRFEFGKWVTVREGRDLTIVATGAAVAIAVDAAQLLAEQGLSAGVLDAVYLKPVDVDAVLAAAGAGPVVTIEEHMHVGGLGSIVAEILGTHGLVTALERIAVRDEAIQAGVPAELLEYYGLTPAAVAQRAVARLRQAAG